ncbi:MAG: preprotein translocase subunit SecD family protein [Candidatus Methanofastidiosia archaeon]
MNLSFLRHTRLLLWFLILLGSIIAINPSFGDGFDSNLDFGIEIDGGSLIILELEGNLVQLEGERDPIVKHLIEEFTDIQLSITESGEDTVTFHVEDLAAHKSNIDAAITWANVTFNDEENTFVVEVSEKQAHAQLLRNITNGSKVTLVSFEGEDWFEVRRSLTEEEEMLANDLIDYQFVEYLLEWYAEQLDDLATVSKFLNRVSPETTQETRDIISTKLNYLGLSDIPVKTISNNRYIEISFAATELYEAEQLVTEQGKFEIKIVVSKVDTTSGDTNLEEDILDLIVTGDEIKNVDHYTNLNQVRQWQVPFTLTKEGAKEFSEKCILYGATTDYASHHIVMLLDDQIVFDAPLSSDFAYSIENGTWKGENLSASFGTSIEDRDRARILWIQLNAGALPVKQRIVSKGYTEPALGSMFLKQIVLAGIGAILAVGLIVYLRYKSKKIVLPLLVTAFSETIIVLGVAVLISHQLDLPSIAGVLATLGTGVDQMVIITDEVLRGEGADTKLRTSLTKRVSRAFSIIFASAATTICAMVPLAYMQLGVLRGFAIVTIIGILTGVFITRPSYAKMIKLILGKEKKSSIR